MDPLRVHRLLLLGKLDVGKIIPYLKRDELLTADECETLTTSDTRNARKNLLDMMPRKGRNHFVRFGKNLVLSGQKELAKQIGVDVDNMPQSPHSKCCVRVTSQFCFT